MSSAPKMSLRSPEIQEISAYGPARSTIKGAPLSNDELRKIDALSLVKKLNPNVLMMEPTQNRYRYDGADRL
jgi:hypothetical protein